MADLWQLDDDGAPVGREEKRGDRYFWIRPDGQEFEMRGYGTGPALNLDPRIDLLQPIFEQAERLRQEDAAVIDRASRTA
jgi:hypothetical protein